MERAIIGSTYLESAKINPVAAMAKLMLWAIVKTVHCNKTVLKLELNKKMLRINKMWSNPLGITCVKPSSPYLIIHSNVSNFLF